MPLKALRQEDFTILDNLGAEMAQNRSEFIFAGQICFF
jgi:hypothetical protein